MNFPAVVVDPRSIDTGCTQYRYCAFSATVCNIYIHDFSTICTAGTHLKKQCVHTPVLVLLVLSKTYLRNSAIISQRFADQTWAFHHCLWERTPSLLHQTVCVKMSERAELVRSQQGSQRERDPMPRPEGSLGSRCCGHGTRLHIIGHAKNIRWLAYVVVGCQQAGMLIDGAVQVFIEFTV